MIRLRLRRINVNLSIGFITAKSNHIARRLLASLLPQIKDGDRIEVINCDLKLRGIERYQFQGITLVHAEPKPCVYGGQFRLTRDEWWTKPSAINTVVCLAKYPMLAFCDDRCVLSPTLA